MLLETVALRLALDPVLIMYTLYWIWQRFFSYQGLPPQIPWVGFGQNTLARGKTSLHSNFSLRTFVIEGYQKANPLPNSTFII